MARFANDLQREPISFTADATRLLVGHAWPGNVRELQHFVQRLMIFCQSTIVRDVDVEAALKEEQANASSSTDWQRSLGDVIHRYLADERSDELFDRFVAEAERLLLSDALRRTKGNQTIAARYLGLTRSTLQAKLSRLGLRDPKGTSEVEWS